jgi:hypothetical protein
MKNVIYQFVKNRKGHHVGCVAAIGRYEVGYSLCNTKAGDKFNKVTALNMALNRANNSPVCTVTDIDYPIGGVTVPHSVRPTLRKFISNRVLRYFKATKVKNVKAPVIKKITKRVPVSYHRPLSYDSILRKFNKAQFGY